jgi:predicted Zn-dependent protease
MPESEAMLEQLRGHADGLDLVGLLAAGRIERGFASSLGHRYWHSAESFHLDWSLYHRTDKAVKAEYAGLEWSDEDLSARMASARRDLATVSRPALTIAPGEYRAYLAPAAVRDLLDMMAWGGFGLKSHRSGQSPLARMVSEDRRLSPQITLSEHPAGGIAPRFTETGFARPDRTLLIDAGRHRDYLVGPRSAREFGVPVTGSEAPDSLDLAAGTLPDAELLERLDTGLWINNLWYCNFSDRNECRITGMTRFACFWVEGGRLVAPIEVMRFDDSIYRLLGERLLGLSAGRAFILDSNTYGERSTCSYRLPGILVEGMRFTL